MEYCFQNTQQAEPKMNRVSRPTRIIDVMGYSVHLLVIILTGNSTVSQKYSMEFHWLGQIQLSTLATMPGCLPAAVMVHNYT